MEYVVVGAALAVVALVIYNNKRAKKNRGDGSGNSDRDFRVK